MIYELKTLASEYLAYLVDRGVNITVSNSNSYVDRNYIFIDGIDIKWGDIKYDVIPFIDLLNNKYKIRQTVIIREGNELESIRNKYSIQDINDDLINDDLFIFDIQIYITRM